MSVSNPSLNHKKCINACTTTQVTHRLQLTTAWKGRLLDKVTNHPITLAALGHAERQRAIEEVAQLETAPSIAPPSRNEGA